MIPTSTRQVITTSYGRRAFTFTLVIAASISFTILTLLAMAVYPGGIYTDPGTDGYRFFGNFFSDLGLTVAHNGQPNTVSMVLFSTALSVAGVGLIAFFIAMPSLFRGMGLASGLSVIGSVCGVIAGLAYVGVALTPADRLMEAHILFVLLAFVSFLVAVLLYLPALFRHRGFRRGYAAVGVAFTLLLAAYVSLIFFGPDFQSSAGLAIQVTGQKIIVYAALIASAVLANGARKVVARPRNGQSRARPDTSVMT